MTPEPPIHSYYYYYRYYYKYYNNYMYYYYVCPPSAIVASSPSFHLFLFLLSSVHFATAPSKVGEGSPVVLGDGMIEDLSHLHKITRAVRKQHLSMSVSIVNLYSVFS